VLVLAAGSLQGLKPSKFACFQGGNAEILLLPDVGDRAEKLWEKKTKEIRDKYNLNISLIPTPDFIKSCFKTDFEMQEGQDIADYLIAKQLGAAWIK
jgi:hypothetical protein